MLNRKKFISSIALTTALLPVAREIKNSAGEIENQKRYTIPPYLLPGDSIGISAVSGHIDYAGIQSAVEKLKEWGFEVKIGTTVGKQYFYYGGTDEERVADFQQMLDDEELKAILCARGGYGLVRIIDRLNFDKFKKKPKWIIGFSDVTVLHSHINSNFNIASLHSKMCNSFPDDWATADPIQVETINSIQQCLSGKKMTYCAPHDGFNKFGKARGILLGGNLKTIESISGSASSLKTKDAILFVEDTGEKAYSIDRMFWHLKRAGMLAQLKGLIIGGFKINSEPGDQDFGTSINEIVNEKLGRLTFPVCYNFPVGHQKNNFALKCGVLHDFEVNAQGAKLTSLQ